MNAGNSHIVPFLFDFLMTRCCVYLRSKLSKFLSDVLAEPARFYFLAIFAEARTSPGVTPTIPAKRAKAREFQDCYCAGIGLCQAPSSRIDRPELTTIRNEAVTRIRRTSIESRPALNTFSNPSDRSIDKYGYVHPARALPGFAWDPSGSRAANHEMV